MSKKGKRSCVDTSVGTWEFGGIEPRGRSIITLSHTWLFITHQTKFPYFIYSQFLLASIHYISTIFYLIKLYSQLAFHFAPTFDQRGKLTHMHLRRQTVFNKAKKHPTPCRHMYNSVFYQLLD